MPMATLNAFTEHGEKSTGTKTSGDVSIATSCLSAAPCNVINDFRQTREHGVAHNLHTLRGELVDRVVSLVPVRITGELNDIDRVDARF